MHRQFRHRVRGHDRPHQGVHRRERHQGRHQNQDVRLHRHLLQHHQIQDVHPGHRDELLRRPDGDHRDDRTNPLHLGRRPNRDAMTWVEEYCSDWGSGACPFLEKKRRDCYPVVDRRPDEYPCPEMTRTGCYPVALPALRRSRHRLHPSKPVPKRQRVSSR